MIKHIIFDCDGVLIDTEIVAAEIVSKYLRSEGVAITKDEFIANFTGKTFTDIIEWLKRDNQLPKDLNTHEVVPQLDLEIRNNQRAIDGATELLQSLHLPFSVVSNSALDYVQEALEKLGVLELAVNRIFSAEQVAKGKPSPLVYELALNEVSLDKAEVVVIEDSTSGVMASTAAGLTTYGFLGGSHIQNGHETKLMDLGCAGTVNNHSDLAQLLTQF